MSDEPTGIHPDFDQQNWTYYAEGELVQIMTFEEEKLTFEPGEKAKWIVGLPGPDVDDCEVISKNEDGSYNIKAQVWGQGEYFEDKAWPGIYRLGGLFKA